MYFGAYAPGSSPGKHSFISFATWNSFDSETMGAPTNPITLICSAISEGHLSCDQFIFLPSAFKFLLAAGIDPSALAMEHIVSESTFDSVTVLIEDNPALSTLFPI